MRIENTKKRKCDKCGKIEHMKKPRRWDFCGSCIKKHLIKTNKLKKPPVREKKTCYINWCKECENVFEIKSRYYEKQTFCSNKCEVKNRYSGKKCKCGEKISDNNESKMCFKCREKHWIKNNKKRHRKNCRNYKRNRVKVDLDFRLRINLRSRVYSSIKSGTKAGSFVKDLGCTIEYLKKHLEEQFYDNLETGEKMTWDNWKHDGWHIDHIKPLAMFDLTDRKQFLEACHYSNLQPLWAKENFAKGAKYE